MKVGNNIPVYTLVKKKRNLELPAKHNGVVVFEKTETVAVINFLIFGIIKEVYMKEEMVPDSTMAFRNHKTHTPEEILAAGGATVFGYKSGKNNLELIQALYNAPVAEPFTEEEWQQTLQQLGENKR